MKNLAVFLAALSCALPARTGLAQAPDPGATLGSLSALIGQHRTDAAGPLMTLEEVERIALVENPEIHVAARRVVAAEAHVPLEGALDDPQFMVRSWGVPFSKPWDYNSAQNMFMIGQALPGPGK